MIDVSNKSADFDPACNATQATDDPLRAANGEVAA